jgi:hypothetical protein
MARSSLVMSLIGAASLGAALLAGCSDNDAKPASSKAGESCVRTADCADGLSCIANVCYAKNSKPTGGGAGETNTPVGPVLGTEGETCSSRLDCAEGLGCFNQRCTTPPTDNPGEGGAPSTGVDLGARGESCRVNGDCSKGLVCIPSSLTAGTGVCDLAEYGIAPTGKKCGGECLTATDCCQLPTALQADPIKSCKDIDDAITTQAIDCATTAVVSALKLCFEKATYCTGCSATTWACTDNTCVYKPACVVAAGFDAPTGCPTNSRIHTLGLSCNPDTLKCVGATAAAACTTDASCLAKPVVDRSLTSMDVCAAGECTCYAGDHQCYRKCARDIECAVGSACDTKAHVCISADACSSNSECAVLHSSLDYECNKGTGTCAKVCSSDHDCSPSGHGTPTFNGMVCGADGFCASIASDCTDDTQCPALFPSSLKTFCVDAPAGVAGGVVSSAISD